MWRLYLLYRKGCLFFDVCLVYFPTAESFGVAAQIGSRVVLGGPEGSARVSQSVPQGPWVRFHTVTAEDCIVGPRSGTIGCTFAQVKQHAKQNRRRAMIGGLDRWFASRAAVGPEHKKSTACVGDIT